MFRIEFIQKFDELPITEQLDLMRQVLERKLNYDEMIPSLSSVFKGLDEFSKYGVMNGEGEFIEAYKALSYRKRFEQRNQYKGRLTHSRALKEIIDQDESLFRVANLLVELFVRKVYTQIEATDEQVANMKLLIQAPGGGRHAQSFVDLYWNFYNTLSNTFFFYDEKIDSDRKTFFVEQVAGRLATELLVAPLNKTINFLAKLKMKVDGTSWNKARGVIEKSCPQFIEAFREMLSSLPHECKSEEDLAVCARLFKQVQQRLVTDPTGFGITTAKDKKEFYTTGLTEANVVWKNEGAKLQSLLAPRPSVSVKR